jgi:hypothetical protein
MVTIQISLSETELPGRPIMFDFDHPVKSMRYGGLLSWSRNQGE